MNHDFAVKVDILKMNFKPGAQPFFESLSSAVLKADEQLSLFYLLGEYLGMKRLELAGKGLNWNGKDVRVFLSELPGFKSTRWFMDRIGKLALRNGWPITVLIKSREKVKAERLKAES